MHNDSQFEVVFRILLAMTFVLTCIVTVSVLLKPELLPKIEDKITLYIHELNNNSHSKTLLNPEKQLHKT